MLRFINKKIFLFTSVLLCVQLYAQKNNDKISLPDVTTVVTGDNKGLNIPAPDLSKDAPLPKKTSPLTPEIPDIKEVKAPVVQESKQPSSFIIEGKIGGGYPASFLGNVLITQAMQQNPFTISFNHNSVSGFGGNSLSRGFNANDTDIYLFKRFELKKGNLEFSGFYGSIQNGFQSQILDLSSVNQNTAKGFISFENSKNSNIQYKLSLDADFYSRFNDITNLSASIDGWQEESTLLSFKPVIAIGKDFNPPSFFKSAESTDDIFNLSLIGTYNIDMDIKGNLVDDETIYISGRTLNRGELDLALSYNTGLTKAGISVGVVAGDHQNDNKVIFPFNASLQTSFLLKNETQIFLKAEGGLESHKTDINNEEKTYKYTAFSVIPNECTSWYAKALCILPLGKNVTFSAAVDYKTSALGNGFWEADYVSSNYSGGLFAYSNVEKTMLSTDFSASFDYNDFILRAMAKINFLDLKPLEARYNYDVSLEYTGESRFGGNVKAKGSLDGQDLLPIVNLEGVLNLSETKDSPVKIALEIEDLLKLVTGTTRNYAGNYICESGKVSLIIKFRY